MAKPAGLLIALSLAATAYAQPPELRQPPGERTPAAPREPRVTVIPRFESVDKNGDGALDRKEARAVEGLKFSAADADGSATVDSREYAIAMTEVAEDSRPRH
jgi:hypothetical protein